MFSSLAAVTVALSAGRGHVERIDGGAGISFGKDGVRIAMATGAWMLFAVGMNAALEFVLLFAMACGALHGRWMIGMRVILDVGVTVVAFETAVDACGKLLAVNADVVAAVVFHGGVAMAGEAIGLCMRREWRQHQEKRYKSAESRSAGCESCEASGARAEKTKRSRTPKGTDSHWSAYAPPSPNMEGA